MPVKHIELSESSVEQVLEVLNKILDKLDEIHEVLVEFEEVYLEECERCGNGVADA